MKGFQQLFFLYVIWSHYTFLVVFILGFLCSNMKINANYHAAPIHSAIKQSGIKILGITFPVFCFLLIYTGICTIIPHDFSSFSTADIMWLLVCASDC